MSGFEGERFDFRLSAVENLELNMERWKANDIFQNVFNATLYHICIITFLSLNVMFILFTTVPPMQHGPPTTCLALSAARPTQVSESNVCTTIENI